MNKYDNYVVYRKPMVMPYTGEVLTELVVVDSDSKAKEYLKWMFGPKTILDIIPSLEHEGYMLVDVIVDFLEGLRYRGCIPMQMFSEGKFYNGYFKGIVNQLLEKVLDSWETTLCLTGFYDVMYPQSIIDELEAIEPSVDRPANLEQDW